MGVGRSRESPRCRTKISPDPEAMPPTPARSCDPFKNATFSFCRALILPTCVSRINYRRCLSVTGLLTPSSHRLPSPPPARLRERALALPFLPKLRHSTGAQVEPKGCLLRFVAKTRRPSDLPVTRPKNPSLLDGLSSLDGSEIGRALMGQTSRKEDRPTQGRSRKESQPPSARARAPWASQLARAKFACTE